MTFDIEKMQKSINSGTISLPAGMTHQERREFIRGELIRLQEENPCTVCEDTGYVDNPNYRTDRDSVAQECPHCHGTGVEPEESEESWYCWEEQEYYESGRYEDILTDNQLKGIK